MPAKILNDFVKQLHRMGLVTTWRGGKRPTIAFFGVNIGARTNRTDLAPVSVTSQLVDFIGVIDTITDSPT